MITPVGITNQVINEIWRHTFQAMETSYEFVTNVNIGDPISLRNYSFECESLVPLPQNLIFHDISHRPDPYISFWTWNPGLWTNKGILKISKDSIRFEGKKGNINIMFLDIKKISYDQTVYKWISIEYIKEQSSSYALFSYADPKIMDRIFEAIKSIADEKKFNFLIEDIITDQQFMPGLK